MTKVYISFTPEKLKEFKKLYEATKPNGIFIFEGREVLKEYAKYVIIYLEGKFKGGDHVTKT